MRTRAHLGLIVLMVSIFACEVLAEQALPTPGNAPTAAMKNCQSLYAAGVRLSGTYWINPTGRQAVTAWCDMETNGGGWTLLYNSVAGVYGAEFWYIPYAERLMRRGRPDINAFFYDGSFYQSGMLYMDVVEDLRGKIVVAFEASVVGFNVTTMRFIQPRLISGSNAIFEQQFSAGWSSVDFDGDDYAGQCSTQFGRVTQHYGNCYYYNLGAGESNDANTGPYVWSSVGVSLGLMSDGSTVTPVRRISRFVKW
jgi:hypothetical protein